MWDLTLPGYKYLGPGNKLDKGESNNENDRVALAHDIAYDFLEKKGFNPYTQYGKDDERAYQEFSFNDYGGALGKLYFGIKRNAAKAGLVGPPGKRLRGKHWDDKKDGQSPGEPSLPNSTDNAQVNFQNTMNGNGSGEGDGSGNQAGLRETPIDNPYVVFRGPPDYTFASLPYVETRYAGIADYYSRDHIFRLTSPYDCSQANSVVGINAGAGVTNITPESADGTLQSARWFNYYSGLYNYYHVVSCQYNVFVENLSTEPLWVYRLFYNDDQPNTLASNDDMQLWPNTMYHYLDRRALAITGTGKVEVAGEHPDDTINAENINSTALIDNFENTNMVANNGVSKCVISGEYRTGQHTGEIRLDSSVENWTATNTNPLLPEKLLIRVKPVNDTVRLNSATSSGDDLKYKIVVKLNYLVEFKELPVGLRYPVQRQPLTVTIAADVESTN
ncbi:putative capsid protein [Phytophthora parasitica virus]|uniref:putative capsid protein n=1 Tax=Phytophthora parasitica virus TaxID=1608451 RepID=UPI0005B56DB2|nr:putative capsid protein [Phytophthora parasitica virus]AJK30622.1 putative capsid protein [Phytophthora parasitica virus]AJK30625.1 putative capsid protein [Phytophthora parasitica virus]